MSKIALIPAVNFGTQLIIDLISPRFVDRIGYQRAIQAANVMVILGLLLLSFLPDHCKDPFVGMVPSVIIYATGGGLTEVVLSPMLDANTKNHNPAAMSALHAAYAWWTVGVILLSTLFFTLSGIKQWRILTLLWMIPPFINTILFGRIPKQPFLKERKREMELGELIGQKEFRMLVALMFCTGAIEMSIAQWASAFAESTLHLTNIVGNLAGPLLFTILYGISRTLFGVFGRSNHLRKWMRYSLILCVCSYLLILSAPTAPLSLIGLGLAGFSVGIFWPGTLSLAAKRFSKGGTLLFSLLAFSGDVGCLVGPTVVGGIPSVLDHSLIWGIGFSLLFPVLMFSGLRYYFRCPNNTSQLECKK